MSYFKVKMKKKFWFHQVQKGSVENGHFPNFFYFAEYLELFLLQLEANSSGHVILKDNFLPDKNLILILAKNFILTI